MRLDKVAAFITRDEGQRRELLVIDHPTAGVQLPAGTADTGETPEAAVRREVAEETGLRNVGPLTRLATFSQLRGQERVMLDTTAIQAGPGSESPLLPQRLYRGWYVRELVRQQDKAYVVYDEWQFRNNRPQRLLAMVAGWVPQTAVTSHLDRHLFHAHPPQSLPVEWWADPGDHGYQAWRLYWLPLANAELVSGQQAWLDRVKHQLLQD